MNKSIIKYVFLLVGVSIVLGYIAYAVIYFSVDENDIKCKNITINIEGKIPLVKEQEINDLLLDYDLHPIGVSMNRLRTDKIERHLEKNNIVSKVVCYHSATGDVFLNIQLRNPKFLVMGNESYYVDDEKEMFEVPLHAVAYVPVVTGRVTKTMAKGSIFDFVDYICKNAFWNAQIAQIHVRDDLMVELVPRVGDAIIFLGKLNQYEEKLERVYKLYSKGFNQMGWNRYKRLDLQFDNQIVAVKNDKFLTDF